MMDAAAFVPLEQALGYGFKDKRLLALALTHRSLGEASTLTLEEKLQVAEVAVADISRIRKAALDRFTIDRLMRILDRLNRDVQVKVSIARRHGGNAYAPTAFGV